MPWRNSGVSMTPKEVTEMNKKVHDYVVEQGKAGKYPLIPLTEDDYKSIEPFCLAMAKEKSKEGVHKMDPHQRAKRFSTGFIGERAVEKWLDKEITDRTIGKSKDYSVPDLKPLDINCGVKTVELGKCHLVPKKPKWHELMVYIAPASKDRPKEVKSVALIIGVACPDMITKYSHNDLVKDSNAKKRKNGFYGVRRLWVVKTLQELREATFF